MPGDIQSAVCWYRERERHRDPVPFVVLRRDISAVSAHDLSRDGEAEAGPTELTLDLKPGTYFFQCDVHPATMLGTLIVN